MSPSERKACVVSMIMAMMVGCAASREPTRIEIGGTSGGRVTGYYLQNGRRVELDTALPTTLSAHGISQLAVRKVNPADELRVSVSGHDGSMATASPSGKPEGIRVQIEGGISFSLVSEGESLAPDRNAIRVISPYWYQGTWVFDDPATGIAREPFVAGVPEMINYFVRDIPSAKGGFRLTFSAKPFPDSQQKLDWVRAEAGGNYYRLANPSMEGWLCPAMFRYFDEAPKTLYVRADPIGSPSDERGAAAK